MCARAKRFSKTVLCVSLSVSASLSVSVSVCMRARVREGERARRASDCHVRVQSPSRPPEFRPPLARAQHPYLQFSLHKDDLADAARSASAASLLHREAAAHARRFEARDAARTAGGGYRWEVRVSEQERERGE